MRISDDRYNRDRLRFDLAIRMMRHEARTCTIRVVTGLTEDRVRKVFRAYLQHEPAHSVHRYRGKSPQAANFFLQSTIVNFEATTLACLFYILGVVPRDHSPASASAPPASAVTLERAEALCLAYEAYEALHSSPRLSFEHAWFLLGLLLKNDELKLSSCVQCGRFYLTDAARARVSHCGCNAHRLGWPRRRRASTKSAADAKTQTQSEDRDQRQDLDQDPDATQSPVSVQPKPQSKMQAQQAWERGAVPT